MVINGARYSGLGHFARTNLSFGVSGQFCYRFVQGLGVRDIRDRTSTGWTRKGCIASPSMVYCPLPHCIAVTSLNRTVRYGPQAIRAALMQLLNARQTL